MQRKGLFRRALTGARGKTVADMTRPVVTNDEVALYFQLHAKHTKNSKTDWGSMLRDWNLTVAASLQQTTQPVPQLGLKNARQLQQFEKAIVGELARREGHMLLNTTPMPAVATAATTLEQAVNNMLDKLMEGQRKQQQETEAAATLADMSTTAGLAKGSGRGAGGGQRACTECRAVLHKVVHLI
jgi:hypothetical protein